MGKDDIFFLHGKIGDYTINQQGNDRLAVSVCFPIELVKHLDSISTETGRARKEIIQLSLKFAVERREIKE